MTSLLGILTAIEDSFYSSDEFPFKKVTLRRRTAKRLKAIQHLYLE